MIAVTRIGAARGSGAAAAATAAALADGEEAALLVELGAGRPRRPAALASPAARRLELTLAEGVEGGSPAARGNLCHLHAGPGEEGLERAAAAAAACREAPLVMHVSPEMFRPAIEDGRFEWRAALLRAEMPAARGLVALAVPGLRGRGIRVKVMKRPLGWVASRRALAGLPAAGSAGPIARLVAGERAQALPGVIGAAAIVMIAALALVSIAGALSGKSRLQRAADLAALSAARSLRDDLPRLLSPPLLPEGRPNPRHLGKAEYLRRARAAGRAASLANGVGPDRLLITFPDRASFAPLRARARILADVEAGGRIVARTAAGAMAEAAPPASAGPGGAPAFASGGGYSGPLAYRQGEDMRPDVAAAFDRMSAGAAADGVALVVNSGFRSDAEQAVLFAANPDPRWVAPPGQSLHRCATELDLGPPEAYGWLAANARRFGFVQRYSWEPWHYGFEAGPPPCSAAGDAVTGSGSDGRTAGEAGLPGFVPGRYRAALIRSASRWGVSAALLAAQLMAESNFNPYAASPAGAQGIAQFIPSTAAAYGLTDPFDPEAAIDAQAHLMADLLRQFGAVPLALAAYNAGPAPVAACECVPAIPETTAYVARIMGLLEGSGAIVLAAPLEVRLIE